MVRLVLLILTLALATACDSSDGRGGDEQGDEERKRTDPRTLVEVQAVERGSVGDYLVASGTVESEAQADLVPETTGTVVAIKAEEGDFVKKGQVLAIIDNASLDAGLARAQAELARVEADLSKVEELHRKGAVSDKDLRDARYALDTARTSAREARGTQGSTRLVSPISGTVSARDLKYGEVAGGQRAFQVVDLDKLRVVVRLPERDLGKLKEGQPALLSSVYDEETTVPGRVERISPTVDPSSGTVGVTVAIQSDELVLRPGQYVSVRIEVGRHDQVLTLDKRALTYEEGDPIVFRVRVEEPPPEEEDEDEARKKKKKRGWDKGDESEDDEEVELPGPYRIARKVPVELGFAEDDQVEVVGGIELGDEIVLVGNENLRDESRVRYVGDPRLEDMEPKEDDADGEAKAPETDAGEAEG